jgi:hypothetical protein
MASISFDENGAGVAVLVHRVLIVKKSRPELDADMGKRPALLIFGGKCIGHFGFCITC